MFQEQAFRRGYLNEEFRLFYLKDGSMEPVDWHYHDFHKILVFLRGHGGYAIEGRSYALEPGDMVLVPRGSIHRPEVEPGIAYGRFVLYISPAFLADASSPKTDLASCFRKAQADYSYVLRPQRAAPLLAILEKLREVTCREGFGQDLLCRAYMQEFLVWVNRDLEDHRLRYVTSASCDEKIVSILRYLNLHLAEPISIDDLSRQFFMSKYYMMRRFKAETGYTIHGYLTEKRLFLAREKIAQGMPLNLVSGACGFGDYSTFSRAYKKRFGVSPNVPLPKGSHIPGRPLD